MFDVTSLTQFNGQMSSYLISDIDDASDPKYYGFLAKDGSWYIMRENTAAKTYRYIKGESGYTTNWTNRASLTYQYVNQVFHV